VTGLQKRLAVSGVMIAVSLSAIFIAPEWFFFLVIEAFILTGLHEYLKLAAMKGVPVHPRLSLLCGGLLPLGVWFGAETLVLLLSCLALFAANFRKEDHPHALLSTALGLFGILYVAWFFSFMSRLHALNDGPAWVFYAILTVKGGDAAAYFVGKRYGRRRLAEAISPKKSIEGAIGGFVATLVLSIFSAVYLPAASLWHLVLLGVVTGVLSQLGDLVESLIKRDVGVKDSGQVPGLGGILDVMDSLLLTVPFIYTFVTAFHLA